MPSTIGEVLQPWVAVKWRGQATWTGQRRDYVAGTTGDAEGNLDSASDIPHQTNIPNDSSKNYRSEVFRGKFYVS